jgi:hypothetical protein
MRVNYLFSLLVLGVISGLAFTGCGESTPPLTENQLAAEAAWAEAAELSEALGYVASSKASRHMEEEATVRGTVTDYQYDSNMTGKPFTLLFGNPGAAESGSSISDIKASRIFRVVVWEDSRKNFPANFAATYPGNMVCATGTIVDFEGSPAIEAQEPSQLKIDC